MKSLLIGCGGGFQQEIGQPYSPVADWVSSVDLFLEDEGQQYGNMEEAATVAKTRRLVWKYGQLTTGKRQVVLKRGSNQRCFVRNFPSALLP